MDNRKYLTDIPIDVVNYGFSKVLLVRKETIHLKHILTEIFSRKTIDIEQYLCNIDMSLMLYLENIITRLRKIYKFPRKYDIDPNVIVQTNTKDFFPTLDLYKSLNNIIVLDFDGTITDKNFYSLYELCISRCKTIVCTANPTVNNNWFEERGLSKPFKIYANKGKKAKIHCLIKILSNHDNVFYIDNEEEYLIYAWLFGIRTFLWKNNKIVYYTKKTK